MTFWFKEQVISGLIVYNVCVLLHAKVTCLILFSVCWKNIGGDRLDVFASNSSCHHLKASLRGKWRNMDESYFFSAIQWFVSHGHFGHQCLLPVLHSVQSL
jgi:hypothetical protein